MRVLRAAGTLSFSAALTFVVVLFAAGALPMALGYHSYVMLTGSMRGTINPGDVEVVQTISPRTAKVGEIVAFRDPVRQDALVSHRVRAIKRVGNRIDVITQGDANTGSEHWSVPVDGTVGRVVYRVPKLGYAVEWLGTPVGKAATLVAPALLLMLSLLRRLWRSPDPSPRIPHGHSA
jgi:signal peptidase I